MHRAVSPTEPTPRWVPCITFKMLHCHVGRERDPVLELLALIKYHVSCACTTQPGRIGPRPLLSAHLKHYSWLGLKEFAEPSRRFDGCKLLKVCSIVPRSLSALSAYHSGLITPMKIRTETPGNLRLYSGSPTRSEKEQVSISSFYYKERVSTMPKSLSQYFSFSLVFFSYGCEHCW